MNVYAVRCVYNGRSSTHVLSLLFVLGCIVLRKWRKCFMQRDVDWDNTVFLCNSKRGKEIMAGRKKHMFWSDNGGQMPTKQVGSFVLHTFCVILILCSVMPNCAEYLRRMQSADEVQRIVDNTMESTPVVSWQRSCGLGRTHANKNRLITVDPTLLQT